MISNRCNEAQPFAGIDHAGLRAAVSDLFS
jgi:hypothetical protein